jgi:hypothetical protein
MLILPYRSLPEQKRRDDSNTTFLIDLMNEDPTTVDGRESLGDNFQAT